MHIVHVEKASVVLFLNDALDICGIARVRRSYRPARCVIRVRGILASPYALPKIDDGYFTTDGLGCFRLLWWIINSRPGSANAQRNRFNALFDENPTDALIAALRIFTGEWTTAPGECKYFCTRQLRHHPREMAAISMLGTLYRAGLIAPPPAT